MSTAARRKPGDPLRSRHDGDVLVVSYSPCGRGLRPHSIVTTKGEYDAAWSKSVGALLVHNSGGGLHKGQYFIDAHHTYWISDGVKLTRWDRRKKTTVRASARWIAANDVTLLAKIRRDPFVDASYVDGHIVECSICNDYLNDDDNAPCPHLRWSDDANLTIGPGSYENAEAWLPASVAKVCEHLGRMWSKELRDAIAGKRFEINKALQSELDDLDAEPEAYGGDGCEPAMLWLDMLTSGKELAPARAAMLRWIDDALTKGASL